jgi:hypothetical protein
MKINFKNVPSVAIDSRFQKVFDAYNKETREYMHYLHSVAENPSLQHERPAINTNRLHRISELIKAELSKRINMDGLDFYENYVCRFDGNKNAFVQPIYRIVFKDMK